MNKKFAHLVLVLAAACLMSTSLQAQGGSSTAYQEGLHYFLIEDGPHAPEGTMELVEVFSYLCTHCNTFEPYINSWVARNAETVKFTRIPVVFGRKAWEIYARAYVTSRVMGLGDDVHSAMMDRLWKEKNVMRTMDELAGFYSNYGVEAEAFLATSRSFAVDARMRKEQSLVQTFGIRATPTLVLNGKYRISANQAVSNFDVMLDVVDYLVATGAE